MKKIVGIIVIVLALSLSISLGLADGEEPAAFANDRSNARQEAEDIDKMAGRSPREAFDSLKNNYLHNDKKFLVEAVVKAYGQRKKQAVELAISQLSLPTREMDNGRVISRHDDFYIAKLIIETFPREAADNLLLIYRNDDALTKKNVIRVSGSLIDDQAIKELFIEALDDKTILETEDTELVGEPLRICDEAYNQLVLHYKIKGVLRTIGSGFKIEIRDYHINILKEKLAVLFY
jgi:hypothetical protein